MLTDWGRCLQFLIDKHHSNKKGLVYKTATKGSTTMMYYDVIVFICAESMESIKFKEIEIRFLNLFSLPSEEKLVNCKLYPYYFMHKCILYSSSLNSFYQIEISKKINLYAEISIT